MSFQKKQKLSGKKKKEEKVEMLKKIIAFYISQY